MKYKKEDIYVGFTFGPRDTRFIVTKVGNNISFEAIKSKIDYPNYGWSSFLDLISIKDWDYHVTNPVYEIY